MENELLALTSAYMMALKQNLAHLKKSSSLTFLSINESHDVSRDHLAKNRKYCAVGGRFKNLKSSNNIFLIHTKYF